MSRTLPRTTEKPRKPEVEPPEEEQEEEEEAVAREFDSALMARLLTYIMPFRLQITFAVLLTLIVTGANLLRPYLFKVALDGPLNPQHPDLAGLNVVAALYFLVALIQFGGGGIRDRIMGWLGQEMLFQLRQSLFVHIQRLSLGFYDRHKAGRIITRFTSDIGDINELITTGIVSTFSDVFVLIGIMFVMLYMDWKLSLLTFTIMPVLLVVVTYFRNKVRAAWRDARRARSIMNGYFAENILGVRVVQAYSRQDENLRRFSHLSTRHLRSNLHANALSSAFGPTISVINSVAIAIVIWFGGVAVLQQAVSLGVLVAFMTYVQRFFQPLQDISQRYNQMQAAMAASERVFELLDQKPEVVDAPDAKPLPRVTGHVKFDNVVFGYVKDQPVLRGISLEAMPGQTVALVGRTGAGKTSIINVLCRFYDIQSGAVTIDGHDIRRVTIASLRSQIGLVLQEPFLFSGTIQDNIRYGKLNATQEEVEAAAKAVHLHDFIMAQPFGYDALVGERGTQLSVGQRQLLSFARALIADPRILILDEATSSVDTQTERLIQEALQTLMRGRTSFVIAHRLSTIRNADQVLVLDQGQIVERGTHDELLAQKGYYYRLYTMQFAYQEEAGALLRE